MNKQLDDRETFEQLYQHILEHLLNSDDAIILDEIAALHYADLAEMLMLLEEKERNRLFTLLTSEQTAAVLSEVDSEVFAELFDLLKRSQKIVVLDLMGQDDIVDILGEVPLAFKQRVMALLDDELRLEIQELLGYDEDTAGGIMTKDFIDIKRDMTVEQATVYLRSNAPDAETVYYVYVTDDKECLVGIISLRQLIVTAPWVVVGDIMQQPVISVHVTTDQEEVARVVSKYDLLAVPVIDDAERLVGIITVDDVIDVIEEEATEDILRFAGMTDEEFDHHEESLAKSIYYSVRARLPWLVITIFGGLLSAFVISGFQGALAADQTLALFMPLLAGMGGNVGTQSSTLTVRNIALYDLKGSLMWRTLLQEVIVGFFVGLICAGLVGALSYFMRGRYLLSIIVAVAMWANIITAATIGTIVPLVFKRIGVDPAVASAPFITTTIDITGLSIYFTLATALMFALL